VTTLKLTGAGLSPFTRKTRVALAEKGLAYEHDPMAPFGVSAEYKRKHPLGKIPLLEVDGRPLPDSSAICAYLEKLQPTPALYPSEPFEYARAIWFEELADSAVMGGVATVFQQRVMAPLFFKKAADESLVQKAQNETLPPLFDYLERELGDADFLVGNRFTIADLALGSILVNYVHGKGRVDAARWPKLAAHVERTHSRPSFKGLIEEDRNAIQALGG
jgi:glutathione S-transferase